MTRQCVVKILYICEERKKESQTAQPPPYCHRAIVKRKKNYLLIFLYRNNFLFLIQFEGSKTDSWNVVNMSNFSLSLSTSFPHFDFQINKDGLKCLPFDPFLPSPSSPLLLSSLYLAICVLKAYSSSSSNVFINFSVYCILIFVFLSQK